jgi:hypothetical protein
MLTELFNNVNSDIARGKVGILGRSRDGHVGLTAHHHTSRLRNQPESWSSADFSLIHQLYVPEFGFATHRIFVDL